MTEENQAGLLHGVAEIGAYLGLSERQAKHLITSEDLPTFKMGRNVCALRSKLDAWLEAKANEGEPKPGPKSETRYVGGMF